METQKQDNMREKDFPNRRQPWTAVFLSLISPGLGHVYCGSIQIGIGIMMLFVMFSTLWLVGIMHPKTPALPFSIMMWGVISLATVLVPIDAYRTARKTRYDYSLKDYNRWAVYLMLIWISGAGCIGYAFYIKTIVGNFRVPKNTMVPTIMARDRAFSNNIAYDYKNPEYGDVVLFKNPKNRKSNYIKRVVALGGDTVEMSDGQLLINGMVLERELVGTKTFWMKKKQVEGEVFWETNGSARYQTFFSGQESGIGEQKKDFGPVTVPQYHCFVMGDNRHSEDSRMFGSISYGALKGRFTQIYWPPRHWGTLDPKQK
ncbi:MAG: signal peptidase I [Planctomycetota bacterium]|jgi:signal peptidase I